MEESSASEWQENILMDEKLIENDLVVLVNESGEELAAESLENLTSDHETMTFGDGNYYCVLDNPVVESQKIACDENVSVEQVNIMGTTADESMAVEALSQLGGMFNIHENDNGQSFPCDTCGEQFNTTRDLQVHIPKCPIRVVKLHVCSTCNESFDREGELTNHMVCHQTDKPHACRVCGNLFRRKADLYNHMTSHQLVRPHLCSECGVDFQRPSSLTNHMKIHKYHPGRLMASSSLLNITKEIDETPIVISEIDAKVEGLTEMTPFNNEDASIPQAVYYETIADSNDQSNNGNLAFGLPNECWDKRVDLVGEDVEKGSADQISTQNAHDPLLLEPQYFDFIQDYTECTTVDVETSSPADELNLTKGRKCYAVKTVKPKIKLEFASVTSNERLIEELAVPYSETDNDDEDGLLYSVDEDQNITSGTKPSESRPYKCNRCDMTFSRLKALQCHAQVHEDQWGSTHQCVKCSETLPDAAALHEHQQFCQNDNLPFQYEPMQRGPMSQSIASMNKGKHDCPDCEKKFTTKQKLFRHMWIHRKKHIECEMCGMSAATQADLDDHRRLQHPGDTPYVCPTCSKSFASRQSLWEHGRVHGGPAASNYWCHECKKSFSSRQGYLIHTRTHTGERPYGCRYCLKAFRDGGTLRKHERIHTGERPHVCPICYRAFNQKVVLREHVRWVHAANRSGDELHLYTCQVCSRVLGDREELCAHIVKHSDELAKLAKNKDARSLNMVPNPAKEIKITNKLNVSNVRIKKKPKKSKLSPSNLSNIQKPKRKANKNILRAPVKKAGVVVVPPREYTLQVDLASAEIVKTEKLHQCGMCAESFGDRIELLSHVRVHI